MSPNNFLDRFKDSAGKLFSSNSGGEFYETTPYNPKVETDLDLEIDDDEFETALDFGDDDDDEFDSALDFGDDDDDDDEFDADLDFGSDFDFGDNLDEFDFNF